MIVYDYVVNTLPPFHHVRGSGGNFPFVVSEYDFFSVTVSVSDETSTTPIIGQPPVVIRTPVPLTSVTMSPIVADISILVSSNSFTVSGYAHGTFTDKFFEFRGLDGIITRTTDPYSLNYDYYAVTRYKPDPNRFKYITFTINLINTIQLEVINDWDVGRLDFLNFVNHSKEGQDGSSN